MEFFYKPSGSSGCSNRKRPRAGSICSLSEVPTVINDAHILNAFVPDQHNYHDTEIKQIMETWSDIG